MSLNDANSATGIKLWKVGEMTKKKWNYSIGQLIGWTMLDSDKYS